MLFIMLYKVVLTFKPVGMIIQMKAVGQYFSGPSYDAVYYAVQGGSNFLCHWMESLSVIIQMKTIEVYCGVMSDCYTV